MDIKEIKTLIPESYHIGDSLISNGYLDNLAKTLVKELRDSKSDY